MSASQPLVFFLFSAHESALSRFQACSAGLFVRFRRRKNKCLLRSRLFFSYFLLTNPRFRASKPASQSYSFASGAGKTNVCFAAACFSFAPIILYIGQIGKKRNLLPIFPQKCYANLYHDARAKRSKTT